ncbi:hypothetical protein DB88DRAFT_145008 [Papiliotrema laurentii]|uniref:Uncharacterized protein n=1 Tax=Papiliotrema laurentii TaxID=5418 RepID=A0AAD9FTP2_PAPLA|nr:hypothetical protein DB88DRAFT_145008 [Papiliotrema laurentii]
MDDSDISTPPPSHKAHSDVVPPSLQHWPLTPRYTPTQSTGASRQPSQPPSRQPSPSPSASSAGSPFQSSEIPQINIIPPTPPEQHEPFPSSVYSGERPEGPHVSSQSPSENVASPRSASWQSGSSGPLKSQDGSEFRCRTFERDTSVSNRNHHPCPPPRRGSLGSNPLTSATIDGPQPHVTIHIPFHSGTASAVSKNPSLVGTALPQEHPPSIARPASAPPSLPPSPTNLLRGWEAMRIRSPSYCGTVHTSLSGSSSFDHPPKPPALQDGYQTSARRSASNSTSSTIAGSLSSPNSGKDQRTQVSSRTPSHPACLVPGNRHMRTECGAGQTETCPPHPEDGFPGGDKGAQMFHTSFWGSGSRRPFGTELQGDDGTHEMTS